MRVICGVGSSERQRLRQRPDAILLIAPPFLIGFLGLWLRMRFGNRVPIIYHVQDLQVDAALDLGMLPSALGPVLRTVERLQLRCATLVTTISFGMRQRLLAKNGARHGVALFPNWTDVSAMAPYVGENPYRSEWGLTSHDVVMLYSGNLGAKQGLDDLLHAAAHLRDQTHLHWVIAGQGADRVALEALAEELDLPRMHFLDLQPKERLAEFLSAADIHLLPQKQSAGDLVMPSKLLNIFAVARPVIVAAERDTELERVVRRSAAGLVVPPEDPAELAQAIRVMSSDAVMQKWAGNNGRQFVSAVLDRPHVLGAMSRTLTKLVRRFRGSGRR